ncbi:MAG: pyrroloquinoline quinone biosynthesis protein PqqB [Oligoflexus sp.]
MHVKVLGSAAGGGFPQWNCHCENCLGVRRGTISAQARTQSSIAVSANGRDWILLNASPDIRAQILANDIFAPRSGVRGCAIKGIVLIDAQLDHTSGLFFLREGERLPVYCTPSVHHDLTHGNPILRVLEHYCGVEHHPIEIEDGVAHFAVDGVEGLQITAIPLQSKAPPYSPNRNQPQIGDTIALQIYDQTTGKRLLYAPGLGTFEPHLETYFATSDCLFVDGTFWYEDEMLRCGVGKKLASDMGHLYLSGEGGMIEILERFPEKRKILIHINNTNPILNERSPERRVLDRHQIEVSYDGMDVIL